MGTSTDNQTTKPSFKLDCRIKIAIAIIIIILVIIVVILYVKKTTNDEPCVSNTKKESTPDNTDDYSVENEVLKLEQLHDKLIDEL